MYILLQYMYTGCPIYGEPLKYLADYQKFGQYDYVYPNRNCTKAISNMILPVTLNVYVKVIEIAPC